MNDRKITDAVRMLLEAVDEDNAREGLEKTPQRVCKAMHELMAGYETLDAGEVLASSFSETGGYDQMIIVRDIDFVSFCEHHMLPFTGRVHFGYIPADHVVGLSKIPRLVRLIAARFQIQERMTCEIVKTFERVVKPKGCGAIVEAQHLCVAARGVRSSNAIMVTSALEGCFRTQPETRAEFLTLAERR
jgi:GTP cyclohydrolase I